MKLCFKCMADDRGSLMLRCRTSKKECRADLCHGVVFPMSICALERYDINWRKLSHGKLHS